MEETDFEEVVLVILFAKVLETERGAELCYIIYHVVQIDKDSRNKTGNGQGPGFEYNV